MRGERIAKAAMYAYRENCRLRNPDELQRAERNAVRWAIIDTRNRRSGSAEMQLIDMVFFKRIKTMDGAASELFYSYEWAKKTSQRFQRQVLHYMTTQGVWLP